MSSRRGGKRVLPLYVIQKVLETEEKGASNPPNPRKCVWEVYIYFENCKQTAEKSRLMYASQTHFGLSNMGLKVRHFRVISSVCTNTWLIREYPKNIAHPLHLSYLENVEFFNDHQIGKHTFVISVDPNSYPLHIW